MFREELKIVIQCSLVGNMSSIIFPSSLGWRRQPRACAVLSTLPPTSVAFNELTSKHYVQRHVTVQTHCTRTHSHHSTRQAQRLHTWLLIHRTHQHRTCLRSWRRTRRVRCTTKSGCCRWPRTRPKETGTRTLMMC